jgi:hypothetical protein
MIAKEEIRIFFINQVANWKQYFDTSDNRLVDSTAELIKTLDLFHVFCNDYICHFQDTPVEYPLEWIKKKIEDALIDYWVPIERVANQMGTPIYATQLQSGSLKAEELMKKAGELGIETRKVHLYLEKQAVARRYPFADVFFIGIPYRDATERKWASLAHEFGHQIYWNSSFRVANIFRYPLLDKESIFKGKLRSLINKSTVPNRDKEPLSNLMTDWFEEIFADVIGTRLLGEEYRDSSLTCAKSQIKEKGDLTINDGEHPSPIIRPFISRVVLEPQSVLANLQPDFNTFMGSKDLQKLEIQLIKQHPKDKDVSLGLETVEVGIRIAVGLAQQLIDEKRIQPLRIQKNGTSNFENFLDQIKNMYHYKDTDEEKINKAILAPRVLERFQRTYSVQYCPDCGSQLTVYYCASGHYYY